ncbi:hypothetical protein EBO15_06690 [Actinomadura harenae]|uniref:Uncharacterized protein n=1 Tax=Actinomadura harenae TaxID=2483351 RepID=A0A3M2MAH3_9ACTN|nr:hypothetical protein EBO15_06690 [Actinomadura harenae]
MATCPEAVPLVQLIAAPVVSSFPVMFPLLVIVKVLGAVAAALMAEGVSGAAFALLDLGVDSTRERPSAVVAPITASVITDFFTGLSGGRFG